MKRLNLGWPEASQVTTVNTAFLLCAVMIFGGSSWSAEPGLALLRSLACVCAAIGLWTLRRSDIGRHRVLILLTSLAVMVPALHLVPLPFSWWSALPGRSVIVAADTAMGIGRIARPLSMSPDATRDTLTSLVVPAAILILGIQLPLASHYRMLRLLLLFVAASAGLGLLQASGLDISLYQDATATPGLFANRNHAATLLALIFPLCAALRGLERPGRPADRRWTWGATGIALLAIPLMIVTGSRSGLALGACAMLGAPLVLAPDTAPGSSLRAKPGLVIDRKWLWAAGIGSIVLLTVATVIVSRDVGLNRFGRINEDLRWPLWQSIAATIAAYMPWGSGIGSFALANQILEPDSMLRPDFSNHAHNDWLEIVFTGGLPALLVLIAALGFFARAMLRAWRSRGREAVLARLGAIIVVLFGLASVTDYPLRTPIFLALFILALIWATSVDAGLPAAPHASREKP